MQSKTSYFSKTIFSKNITRFWPVWSGYLLVCLFTLPFGIFANLSQYLSFDSTAVDMSTWRNNQLATAVESATSPTIVFLFAIIAATAVFSYLYTARSANMIHALPMRRECLFITNCLSGFSFLIIPQLVAFLVSIFVCFAMQATQLVYLLQWLVLMSGMAFFAFAFAVFTVLITGHIVAAPAFYLIFNLLYVVFRFILNTIIGIIAYGFNGEEMIAGGTYLSPWYFLSSQLFYRESYHMTYESYSATTDYFQQNLGCVWPYCLAGIVLLILSMVIYKKRHIETAGDVISIPLVKPVFRWSAAICGGSSLTVLILGIFFTLTGMYGNNFLSILIFTLVGGIIIFFLAEMLLQKSFRVFTKKRLTECGIFAAIVTCFLFMIELNAFGLETRLPDQDDIESIYFSSTFPIIAAEEDFSEILSVHKQVVDSKKEFEDSFKNNRNMNTMNYTSLSFDYTLKSGAHVKRSYDLPVEDYYLTQENSVINRILALSHEPEYYLHYLFSDNYNDIVFTDVTIDYFSKEELLYSENATDEMEAFTSSTSIETLSREQYTKVYEALLKDIEEGNYRIYDYIYNGYGSDKVYYNNISMSFRVPKGSTIFDYTGLQTVNTSDYMHYAHINLTTDCTHTLSVLKELGLIDDTHVFLTRKESQTITNKLYP